MKARPLAAFALATVLAAGGARAADAPVLRSDHALTVRSTAPAYAGKFATLYLREVKLASPGAASKGVVLFVHGAGTPADVAFDVTYQDYSWMAHVARAGFDVWALDMEGYGASTRPPAMSDPCLLSPEQQKELIPKTLKAACGPSSTAPITTMSSDWNDLGAAVDYLIPMNGGRPIAIVGWSQGGPRSAGYAAQYPDKVSRLAILAPAYNPTMPDAEPAPLPAVPYPLTFQSEADFKANWDRQAPCAGQYDPAASAAIWSILLKSDPEGAKWGPGGRRAPATPSWGFSKSIAARITTPFLMISGENDKQVPPERVRQLFADLASPQKVFIDLACSSHNAMWEKNRLLLFQATVDWLTVGKVDGVDSGMLRKGY
ncbi:MAG: alpha/beta hydrolase [Caulobacteraceae bacterium]